MNKIYKRTYDLLEIVSQTTGNDALTQSFKTGGVPQGVVTQKTTPIPPLPSVRARQKTRIKSSVTRQTAPGSLEAATIYDRIGDMIAVNEAAFLPWMVAGLRAAGPTIGRAMMQGARRAGPYAYGAGKEALKYQAYDALMGGGKGGAATAAAPAGGRSGPGMGGSYSRRLRKPSSGNVGGQNPLRPQSVGAVGAR